MVYESFGLVKVTQGKGAGGGCLAHQNFPKRGICPQGRTEARKRDSEASAPLRGADWLKRPQTRGPVAWERPRGAAGGRHAAARCLLGRCAAARGSAGTRLRPSTSQPSRRRHCLLAR